METILEYIFLDPIPLTWLIEDLIVLMLTIVLLIYIIKHDEHPIPTILEVFAFVFLYASVYENAAGVMGLYDFGRSYIMIGSVPASVPLIEVMLLITGFWLLDKTTLPDWTKPPIIGLLGMLQDFSLDPLATRQLSNIEERFSGRWNWFIQSSDVNILGIPVFNFPGWMLIMLYGSTCLLIGRWWYRRSGYKPLVGYIYPIISMVAALLLMISPVSSFLLWLGPFFQKGSWVEWIMLAFHLVFPSLLLFFIWRGKMKAGYSRKDLPIFLIPITLHLIDLVFALIGGYTEILWIVILAGIVHAVLLGLFFFSGKRKSHASEEN